MNKTEKTEHCQYIQNEKYEDVAAIDTGLYWRRFKKSNQTFPTMSALPGPLITEISLFLLPYTSARLLFTMEWCLHAQVG